MKRYNQFIEKYSSQLLDYYQKLYDIKNSLGLPVPDSRPSFINSNPELLIFDRWEKNTNARDKHRHRLYEILKAEGIKFSVKSDF